MATATTRRITDKVSIHEIIYLRKKKMKKATQIVYVLAVVLVVGAVVTMLPRVFEMFQIGELSTTCPECRTDAHCDQCGLTGYRCDKKFKDGKEFGTCTKA